MILEGEEINKTTTFVCKHRIGNLVKCEPTMGKQQMARIIPQGVNSSNWNIDVNIQQNKSQTKSNQNTNPGICGLRPLDRFEPSCVQKA